MSRRNDNVELVLTGWIDARRRRDLETIEPTCIPTLSGRGSAPTLSVATAPAVLDNVRSGDGWLPDVSGIELHADGDQVMLGVHSPDLVEIAGERLDGRSTTFSRSSTVSAFGWTSTEPATMRSEAMQARLAQTAAPAEALQRTRQRRSSI